MTPICRKSEMNHLVSTCKQSFRILHLPTYSCRTWAILWVLCFSGNMKDQNYPIYSDSHSIHRLSIPWGQIPFWAATVLTSLLSAIPHISTTCWMDLRLPLGRQSNSTQFFTLPFILPFITAALAAVHLLFLHETGPNNPKRIPSDMDKIPFHPYYTINDILGVLLLVLALIVLVLFSPYLLGDPDNYTPAYPLNIPPHVKQECTSYLHTQSYNQSPRN